MAGKLALRKQDNPFGHPDLGSCSRSRCGNAGGAQAFGPELVHRCYLELQELAKQQHGLDYHAGLRRPDQARGATAEVHRGRPGRHGPPAFDY